MADPLFSRTPWHRAPVNSAVTFCGLTLTADMHLASRPSTATCPYCIEGESRACADRGGRDALVHEGDVAIMGLIWQFGIEVHDETAQARFLVNGRDDVLWTDDVDEALAYLRQEMTREA